MRYTTPAGTINALYQSILTQPHTLIAGSTGSGKSVIINGLIYTALCNPPGDQGGGVWLILCDPKRVELTRYSRLPHTIEHARDISAILSALNHAAQIMESRFKDMDARGLVETDRGHIYVIVDEYADLMLNCSKHQIKVIQHIAELGRAAHVHLILATQAPNRQVITANIAVNMTCKVALRCDSQIESRQIIGVKGAEDLPQYGDCLLKAPSQGITHYTGVKMYTQEELSERVQWWTAQQPPRMSTPSPPPKRGFFHRRPA
jgi:S-DNA-T family DNA segregation ATPase FtsK/SpoIIIE